MLRVCLIWIWLCNTAFAALEPGAQGSAALSLSGCRVMLTDAWSIANNPGAGAWAPKSQAALFAHNAFGIRALNTFAVSGLLRKPWGVLGLNMQHTGISSYSEQIFSLACARKLHPALSAGIALCFGTVNAGAYGKHCSFIIQAGVLARLSPEVDIGFRVFNPTRSRISGWSDERVPTQVSLGLCYRAGKQVQLYLQSESDLAQPAGISFGLVYRPAEVILLRLGYSTQPVMFTFGIGLSLKKLNASMGSSFHPQLGPSSHLTLAFP